MLYRVQSLVIPFLALLPIVAIGQESPPDKPVTRSEVRRWLSVTQDDPEQSEEANRELIAEIEERGVDFALSPEEEWSFGLLEATDELLAAIRGALPEEKRKALLRAGEQERLYTVFMGTYSRADLTSQRSALEAGREFAARFATDPSVKERRNFILRHLPNIERSVRTLERTTWVRRGRN